MSQPTVILLDNKITIRYTGSVPPENRFIKANPRNRSILLGGDEWFYIANNSSWCAINAYAEDPVNNSDPFVPPGKTVPVPFNNIVTTLMSNLGNLFFKNSNNFNDDISSWDTSNVTTMIYMFDNCEKFNQDIGFWDTSKVTHMDGMFQNASEFNQDLSMWPVKQIPSEPFHFSRNCPLTESNKPRWGQDIPRPYATNITLQALVETPKTLTLLPIPPLTAPQTYTIITQPQYGKLTLVSNGVYSYLPEVDKEDVFYYEVKNEQTVVTSLPGTITITNYNENDIKNIPKDQGNFSFDPVTFDGNTWTFGTIQSNSYLESANYNQLGNYNLYK